MSDWKPLPDSEGDWLWLVLWDCGCCVGQSGIAYIYDTDPEQPEPEPEYTHCQHQIEGFTISWEGNVPKYDFEEIKHWMKVELPTPEK